MIPITLPSRAYGGNFIKVDPGDSPTGDLIALYDELTKKAKFLYGGKWDCLGQEPDSLHWDNSDNHPWDRDYWKIAISVSFASELPKGYFREIGNSNDSGD